MEPNSQQPGIQPDPNNNPQQPELANMLNPASQPLDISQEVPVSEAPATPVAP